MIAMLFEGNENCQEKVLDFITTIGNESLLQFIRDAINDTWERIHSNILHHTIDFKLKQGFKEVDDDAFEEMAYSQPQEDVVPIETMEEKPKRRQMKSLECDDITWLR